MVLILRAIMGACLLSVPACAFSQDFDAVEFFGQDSFAPDTENPREGKLHSELKDAPPGWMRFSGSGDGGARGNFTFNAAGLKISPGDNHRSCELVLDVGAETLDASVTIESMNKGGALAWHLRDRADGNYLVQLSARQNGGFRLSLKLQGRTRFTDIPETRRDFETLGFPARFHVNVSAGLLTASVGETETSGGVEFSGAIIPGIAASDQPATLHTLSFDVTLHEDWTAEAGARLAARKALARLREVAIVGLLSGVNEHAYPGAASQLKQYARSERDSRKQARKTDVYTGANLLLEIAQAHPELSLAQHEAGVAALLSSHPSIGFERLKLAVELKDTSVSQLAFAEACRRAGDFAASQKALESARKNLPPELRPDIAMIHGRLLADQGEIARARKVLVAARDDYPGNDHLNAFADSSEVLVNPPTLAKLSAPGPFGLEVLSDLPPDQISPLLDQLAPYVEGIRSWLPDLEQTLSGRIAIFSGPVEYLRAALLVAGDNLDHVAGMYLPHGIASEPTVMGCHAFGEDELLRTMAHELWHLALESIGRASTIPRWLNEGMAVYLSGGVAGEDGLEFTALPSEFRAIENPRASITPELIKRILSAGAQSFYVPGEVRENYFAAWAVVWYFTARKDDAAILKHMLTGDADALKEPSRRADLDKAIVETMAARMK